MQTLPNSFLAPEKHRLLLCLILVGVVLACYRPVSRNQFLNYDDDTYITNNLHVRAGLHWPTVKWAFSTFDAANYHPLTWLSHALDSQLFGLNPAGHHEMNVLLHALNAALIFLLLLRMTGFGWRSFFVAALFALHPINVECVAWAAERKNVLSMLFFLLALHAYVWYARRPVLGRYLPTVFFFVLALLSKPQVITFPFLLLLLDYWPLGRFRDTRAAEASSFSLGFPHQSPTRLVLEKIPFFLLSAASTIITLQAQKAGGAIQTLTQYPPALRVETAIVAYVRYLGKTFWPSKLVALYPHPTSLYPGWQVAACTLLLLGITAIVLFARKQGYLAVGWFWFLGALVPMLGLVQVGAQAMADRYAYIPFLGLFMMLTWLAADCAKTMRLPQVWFAILAAACLLALAMLSHRQVGYWHDTPSFWQRTLALTGNNYVAHDSLGEYLAAQGRTDEAAVQFQQALAIRPDDLPANLNLGAYEHSHGNIRAAVEHYQIVARNAADQDLRAKAYANLGSAYRLLGDSAKAKQCYETAIELEPDHPFPIDLIGLGLIALKSGDPAEAIRLYQRAMEIQPTDVGYLLLAQALDQNGRPDEANAIRARVARASPDLAAAQKQVQSLLGN